MTANQTNNRTTQRILYATPDIPHPSGGVKVLYRHAELLSRIGYDAHVMHFSPGFRCDWFEHNASIVTVDDLRQTDMVIVPETMPDFAEELAGRGIRYCIFVQNGYYVLPSQPDIARLCACYRKATAIISISEDTTDMLQSLMPDCADKIVRVRFPVYSDRFSPDDKENIVTFMPRKCELHAKNVVPWLRMQHPEWHFQPLMDMSEAEVAAQLRRSRIFLAFSDFEGGPLPPIEAAMSGNLVVGYHGWGGREYWWEPNFMEVPVGDVRCFVDRFDEACRYLNQELAMQTLEPGIAYLRHRYGEAEVSGTLQECAEILALYPSN